MSAVAKKIARVPKDECVSCGACARVCPKDAVAVYRGLYAKVDPGRCVGCGRCAMECPAGIITLTEAES
ncbi:MAG: 4Fe-4S binding protein [Pyramidobacter sp.]|nr:4Fe-4S binding protein [Pyramidobacter sp.]